MFKINCSMKPVGTTTPKSPAKMIKESTVVTRAVKKETVVVLNRSNRKRTKRTRKVDVRKFTVLRRIG